MSAEGARLQQGAAPIIACGLLGDVGYLPDVTVTVKLVLPNLSGKRIELVYR